MSIVELTFLLMNAKELLTKRLRLQMANTTNGTMHADVALSNVLWLCTKTNVVIELTGPRYTASITAFLASLC